MPHDHTHSCCGHDEKSKVDFLLWGSLAGVVVLFAAHFLHMALPAWVMVMSEAVHHMVYAMWWGVVAGMVFIGFVAKVPREFVLALLGRGGTVKGILRASSAGVLLDMCSHGILMVAAKLYQQGASIGQVMAFLLSSPWNSLSLTLVLIGLIGVKWTLAFIALSMVIAVVTGYVFDLLVKRGILPANPNHYEMPKNFAFWPEAKRQWKAARFNGAFFKSAARHAITDSQMVLRWLLFGILLAAVLRAVVDPAMFQQYFGPTALGLMVTIVFATVMEVCSEGATPIAADIINRAAAPGNGFAFLMAGVATDYTEVMVLKDTTRSWKIALFLPLITVPQVVLVAWLINIFG